MSKLTVDEAIFKARYHTQRGEAEEALKAVEVAMRAFPNLGKSPKLKLEETKHKASKPLIKEDAKVIHKLIEVYENGHFEAVIEQAQKIVNEFPEEQTVWNIIGSAAAKLDMLDQAILAFQNVISIDANDPRAYNNLGSVFYKLGDFENAVAEYDKALKLKSNFAAAHKNKAAALQRQGELNEAIDSFRTAISLHPNNPDAHNNIGVALRDQGKLDEAMVAFRDAITLKPDFAAAYNNLAAACDDAGLLTDAIEVYKRGIKVAPQLTELHMNHGIALHKNGDPEAAVCAYEMALKIKPECVETRLSLSFALFNLGRNIQALDEYEYRLKSPEYKKKIEELGQPLWDGTTSLKNKTVLVWSEQGVGDTINWSYYLRSLTAVSKRCILLCQEKLVPLMVRSFQDVQVVSDKETKLIGPFDVSVPMGSLCKHFGSGEGHSPHVLSHLKPDEHRVEYWKQRLKSIGSGPYIGISWRSSKSTIVRRENYPTISDWSPLLNLENVTFINLQYGDISNDLKMFRDCYGVNLYNFDEIDHYNDIDEVAALCAALDCVVSPKITVPLLASAVGTHTKLANWRQSVWNNLLLNPVSSCVDIFERDTWEPWTDVFRSISNDINKLKSNFIE